MAGRNVRFGVSLSPNTAELETTLELAGLADGEGLDFLAVPDHPYLGTQVDTFSLIGMLLARTARVRIFPDVANLALRGPAIIAKAAATLDLLSGGRFELGLGAGGPAPAVEAMGAPRRSPAQSLDALGEGIEILRAMWRPGPTVRVSGNHYAVHAAKAGPPPAHEIGIWLGSVGPRAIAMVGRYGDGWAAPIPAYLPYERWRESQDLIDKAAVDAGRAPGEITRIAQLVGRVTTTPATPARQRLLHGSDPIRASAEQWAQTIVYLAEVVGFDTFIFWPEQAEPRQLLRWTQDVIPAVHHLLQGAE
jgi:alkanesulfonate monooxygenase SsuD/methylene tetrahydromethanopterin reductase-like flavin-dependent oxidoreductase (luciferase family)